MQSGRSVREEAMPKAHNERVEQKRWLARAIGLLGGRRPLVMASVYTLGINLLALAGPAYMLALSQWILPSGKPVYLLAATLMMLAVCALGASIDILRERLFLRCAQLAHHRLSIVAARRSGPYPVLELAGIRAFLAGQGPSALCDLPWIPLYLAALMLLHPLFFVVAAAGTASIVGCVLLIERSVRRAGAARQFTGQHSLRRAFPARGQQWPDEQEALARKTAAALLRALRPSLQSAMLGLGAYLVMEGNSHSTSVLAAAIILPRLLNPIEVILAQRQDFTRALASAERLRSLLAAPKTHNRTQSPNTLPQRGVTIVLRRSGDYARNATREGTRSMSSVLRPTAQ